MALCKGFVFSDWYHKSVSVYKNSKVAVVNVVNFVHEFGFVFCDNIWLVHAKHQAIMEKNKLIPHDSSIPVAVFGFSMWLSAGATVGPVIAVMKKTIKVFGSEDGFKTVVSRKKRKKGVLVESIDNSGVAAKASGARSWGFETGDTTESESIDMKEECLVEKTSVDYNESSTYTKENPD
ncbi:hypothetical protein G9A89_017219 [Geosiphon pyriformis]|nr:hypothetical protein G9A89_017219 [Geosiphon pyriformis]